jgi:AraC-like DNA-binding protein
VPVLTIAMDAGFRWLGPFNRAFKADTALTPTEFRGLALTAWPPKLGATSVGRAAKAMCVKFSKIDHGVR